MKWNTYSRLNIDNCLNFGRLQDNTSIHYKLAEKWQESTFSLNEQPCSDSEMNTKSLTDLFEEAMLAMLPWESSDYGCLSSIYLIAS